MDKVVNMTKATVALGGSIVAMAFPEPRLPMYVLVAVLFIDYCSGVARAYVSKSVSSRTGSLGVLKKALMLSVVLLSALLDMVLQLQGILLNAVVFFYIANEAISILENAVELGVPVPSKLEDVLIQLKDGGNKDGY